MINAPSEILAELNSDEFKYANIVTINLGDAYGQGSDVMLYLTDCDHEVTYNGNVYTPDHNLTEIDGISRKASTGSDAVDIVFSVTDENLIAAIKSERYINKPTVIERVIIKFGSVYRNFAIPVRTAWGISHSIDGNIDDRSITLVIDSALGDIDGDNGWYTINASHMQREPNDYIMKHSSTVMTEEQNKKYATNLSGTIDSQVKPPALSKVYGYKNVECIPICMLKHRKTHTSYRHYFTTLIYAISIGECDHVDISNLRQDGDRFDGRIVTNNSRDVGGWSARVRTPAHAAAGSLLSYEDSSDLSFWFEGMDSGEKARMNGMYGKGLTLLFVKNRNRDDWLTSPPKFTVPVRGAKVFDPRLGYDVFSRNPALQYADYLRSDKYGAGNRGVSVSDANISELADHFDQIPDSVGNAGINNILIDVQVDTGKPIVDNMNIWIEGVRLYTSDYYGEFTLRVETKSAVSWVLDEDDLLEPPDYDSGAFTDKVNQLTYTVKQMVPSIDGLVEVEVEATFPPDGSQFHTDWLAEDGGLPLFKSEQLDYVTVLEQAYYWAMVDARIARLPRTMTVVTNARGWLTEVGDIIQFSSEVMDMTDVLWRVDEVSEEDGNVELELVAYDHSFYTPDPNAIPDPTPEAQPPTGIRLTPVSNLEIISDKEFYYLNWTPLTTENVVWYAVEIRRDGVLIVDEPKIAQPPLLLESIIEGSYEIIVTAVGNNDEGDPAVLLVDIEKPLPPTFDVVAQTFELEIALSTNSTQLGTTFELMYSKVDDMGQAINRGKGTTFTIINLTPNTTYYLFARTYNIVGVSEWSSVSVTTDDGQKYVDLVGELPLVDLEAIKAELETIPRAWDEMVGLVGNIFGDALGDKERIFNTERITKESEIRAAEIGQVNSELNTLNNVTLPQLQQDLALLDGRFPITETDISDGSISTPKLQANSVTALKIVSGAISTDKLAANAVSADKIAANAIIGDKIAANAILGVHISAKAITADKIEALAIGTDLLAANAVIASKIATGAITADKIAALAITADKIAANAIGTDELAANVIIGAQATFKGLVSISGGWNTTPLSVNVMLPVGGSTPAVSIVANTPVGLGLALSLSGSLECSDSGSFSDILISGLNYTAAGSGSTNSVKNAIGDIAARLYALENP